MMLFSSYFPQSAPTPYYTFYYDTGHSDEEEIEEQVLRNTVNSEALMTAFHQNQPGTNDNNVSGVWHFSSSQTHIFNDQLTDLRAKLEYWFTQITQFLTNSTYLDKQMVYLLFFMIKEKMLLPPLAYRASAHWASQHFYLWICVFVSEQGAGEGAAVGGSFLGVRSRRPHVPHRQDPKTCCHGDTRVAARGAVDDTFW